MKAKFNNAHMQGIHPDFEIQGRRHQKFKSGLSVAQQIELMSSKLFEEIPKTFDLAFAGVIIGIETVLHNRGSTSGQHFHQRMRRTCWFENSLENKSYTFFLRVFTLHSSLSQSRGKIGGCSLYTAV